MNAWRNEILDKAVRQVSYKMNMSTQEMSDLNFALSDYLDEGIMILRKWRKLKNDNEFLSGVHDNGLVLFMKAKYQANGRDLFGEYSSGSVKANMKQTPESLLKASCKQVL